MSSRPAPPAPLPVAAGLQTVEASFAEVVELIEQARQRAYQAVNTELVALYWEIGRYISAKLEAAVWGEGVVDRLAEHLARKLPGQRGFTRRNLFRMRQFYEVYRGDEKVTPLVTQLPWTHNLIILTQAKRAEEREFYLRLAVQERWGKRELERQLRLAAFEQAVLAPARVSPAVTQLHGQAGADLFKDAYALEFLDLPAVHTEADLHRGLLAQLRTFLIELGIPAAGGRARLRTGSSVFPPRLELPGGHRAQGRALRARAPWQTELLLGSAGSRCPQAPREPRHRRLALRLQRQRGRRVRTEPHAVTGARGAIQDSAARQTTARRQAARVLRAHDLGARHVVGRCREEGPPRGKSWFAELPPE